MDIGDIIRRAAVALCLGGVLAAAGCDGQAEGGQVAAPSREGSASSAPPAAPTTAAPTSPAPQPSSATPGRSAAPAPSTPAPTTTAPAASATLRLHDTGPAVADLQRRLTALHFWVGSVDGTFGPTTQQAVYALQKAAGIGRDGVVGDRTRAALAAGRTPSARSGSGHVIEVDLARQLLLVVDGGRVTQVFNTSTGSGQYYTSQGQRRHAVTPTGRYTVFRQVDGWDDGPLGALYRPKYFNGGIAVHGYTSVPPTPASHGCVRVSIPAMDWLWSRNQLPTGTQVLVY